MALAPGDKRLIKTPPEVRFWRYVDKDGPNGCWTWTASLNHSGYGQFGVAKGKMVGAHRYSWTLHNGPIPDGLHVCHHCDNPPCVNPDHLFIGSQHENVLDMHAKNRGRWVTHPSKVTPDQRQEMKRLVNEGMTLGEASRLFGLSKGRISMIVRGATYNRRKQLQQEVDQ